MRKDRQPFSYFFTGKI